MIEATAIRRVNPHKTIPSHNIRPDMPISRPITKRKGESEFYSISPKAKPALNILSPCRVAIFSTPQIKIPLLVPSPPMALALLEGKVIGVDVGVGNDFVDEGHGQ
jgi:hypothetical protein